MKSTNSDRDFRLKTISRILNYRDEFFMFMKNFTDDLGQDDDVWECLEAFFSAWVTKRTHFENRPTEDDFDGVFRLPSPDRPVYQEVGTREFEEFNQLLPVILLAVIDEVIRYPELLDASPVNPDGTLRRISRRNIRFLISTTEQYEVGYDPGDGSKDDRYDEGLSLGILQEPFPPIVSTFE